MLWEPNELLVQQTLAFQCNSVNAKIIPKIFTSLCLVKGRVFLIALSS